ncbi:MAG: hypothetical protein AB7L90_08415 [Hyphomicrobiaceae bacterium]
MSTSTTKTVIAGLVALATMLSPSMAADVQSGLFGTIADTAPRSLFDQIAETAPRSVFDQLADSAPRSIFEDIQQSAPLATAAPILTTDGTH